MATPIKMPALSPTMEEGTLARWLVKEGDTVAAGDVMAEIETDKATMEFEAVDEGTIAKIEVAEGTEGVKVGTVIAMLAGEDDSVGDDAGEVADAAPASAPESKNEQAATQERKEEVEGERKRTEPSDPVIPANAGIAGKDNSAQSKATPASAGVTKGDRIIASPLAKRIAEQKGIDLSGMKGSGPNGRIVKADVESAQPGEAPAAAAPASSAPAATPAPASAPAAPAALPDFGIPHEDEKLSNVRKVIARRLTESKQTVPHYYLAIDVRLDPLLKLRGELNASLEAQGIKLSVNDLLIKALAKALLQVPDCNVAFAGDTLRRYSRADISVAVAAPSGLITPVVVDAGSKSVSAIASEFKVLVDKAREGKLQPAEYQGGTASLSNLGMYGIKQFEAVINPPQAMIMAVGAGEKRPYVIDDALQIATVMTATGSFDHRAIDGATGAQLMQAFKALVEAPLGLVA
ncbi:pyruvate dehydrogenase complex dihydrolipoamide acetyltransferase [Tsuneonella amylolytica]|uniref:pyruvate dehydrogenase complex dihydrolipoamide acetyltransferase n=1 Tax=Tsuneonella amylolytica TaxID=2338327 RepID=UPI001892A97C|nr:pyruvate dehydrogenase complex dihydrolipoamide acetyltransferase [Tsuneonella amylolytica]